MLNVTPLVSIIIPCFNGESVVVDAVESALEQTYGNTEVIVVDDGSTDRTLERLKPFQDQIRVLTGPNLGACAARNRGLSEARGELIQFLDCDDMLEPGKLARQVPLVLDRRDAMVYCDGRRLSREDASRSHPLVTHYDGDDPVSFAIEQKVWTPAPIHFKERLIGIGGYSEDLPCCHDSDLNVRLAMTGCAIHHLHECLYVVRRMAGSVSSDQSRVLDTRCRLAWDYYVELRNRGALSDRRSQALAGKLARDAIELLRRGRKDLCLRNLAWGSEIDNAAVTKELYSSRWAMIARSILGPITTGRIMIFKSKWSKRSPSCLNRIRRWAKNTIRSGA